MSKTGAEREKVDRTVGLNIPPDTVVMCNSRPLQLVTSYKYLGVFFRQSPQLGGSDLAQHQESLPKEWGLVTR